MLSLVVVAVLSAPADVGSKWSWTFDDTSVATLTPADGLSLTKRPTLDKTTFEVEVIEAAESGWRKLRLTVLQGSLRGKKWELENNYSDVVARPLTPEPLDEKGDAKAQKRREADTNNTLLRSSRLLMLPDTIVAASNGGACTPEVRVAVLKAVARTVARVSSLSGDASDEVSGEATCSKAGHYDVKFTTTDVVGVNVTAVTDWKGSVDVPTGALHASLKLVGTIDSSVEVQGKKRKISGRMTLNSTVTPKK